MIISDGLETCGLDPCEAARQAVAKELDLKMHVIGFDLSEQDSEQLSCIAKEGNGSYFSVNDANQLAAPFTEVSQRVLTEKPEPESSSDEAPYFLDEFEGGELESHWILINPDTESLLVEDGMLLLLASEGIANPFDQEKATNILRLKQPMPNGDWNITVQYLVERQTLRESLNLGLYADSENYLVGREFMAQICCSHI